MAKMLGIMCDGCGRTILDNGCKCVHCGRPHTLRQLNAQKWHHLTKKEVLGQLELSKDPLIAEKQIALAVLEVQVHSVETEDLSGRKELGFLDLPFPAELEKIVL